MCVAFEIQVPPCASQLRLRQVAVREPRVGGGFWPKAEKIIVTFLISMAEVVINVSKGTTDGSARVQDIFDLPQLLLLA